MVLSGLFFVSSPPGVPCGTSSINDPGPGAGHGTDGGEGALRGQPSLEGTRLPEKKVGGFESQSRGFLCLLSCVGCRVWLLRKAMRCCLSATSSESECCYAVPPPPLPIAVSAAWQESFVAVPQSMRQFIASAEAEASGLGQGLGFHRTRAGRF